MSSNDIACDIQTTDRITAARLATLPGSQIVIPGLTLVTTASCDMWKTLTLSAGLIAFQFIEIGLDCLHCSRRIASTSLKEALNYIWIQIKIDNHTLAIGF